MVATSLACGVYTFLTVLGSSGMFSTNPCQTIQVEEVYKRELEAYLCKSELYRDMHRPPELRNVIKEWNFRINLYTVLTVLGSSGLFTVDPCQVIQANEEYKLKLNAYLRGSELYRDMHPPPKLRNVIKVWNFRITWTETSS
ncbi:hypothetical protein THRCLA_22385 [Thraustotheca clavata]|uniref:Secreted protein n=1 Tax=Thraustotheca clavata TaxID=74557 RepID=A0A1V9Z378_9STRA|nr:hypothetical protein THRCLA_22385 [Thraustotheca clavata]